MTGVTFALEVGTEITREWLQTEFGGNVQGGIANVSEHPLIWVFAGRSGRKHGYLDKVVGDQIFEYTGQGQEGDQEFTRNNLALKNHKATGKAVQVFADFDDRLVYAGRFELADDPPYRMGRAPSTSNPELRDVIVFRLRPIEADVGLLRAVHAQKPKGREEDSWSAADNEALVDAYFAMLKHRIELKTYSDEHVLAELQAGLHNGDSAVIRRRLESVSGILKDQGSSWNGSYAPSSGRQPDLAAIVSEHVGPGHEVSDLLSSYEMSTLAAPSEARTSLADVLVPPPSKQGRSSPRSSANIAGGQPQAMNAFRNKELGTNGERWVRDREVEELKRLGYPELAKRVEWVAEHDDSAGFDVRSFRPGKKELWIEVKTTNYNANTPFYITKHEVDVSESNPDKYSLYRVHGFRADPRVFVLPGSVKKSAELEPSVYVGWPRSTGVESY